MRVARALAVAAAAIAVAAGCTGCSSSSSGSGASSPTGSATATSPATAPASTPASTPASMPATTAAAPSAAPSSAASSTASGRPADWCVDGEITVGETANPEGSAAGHNSVVLTFTNTSTRTCVLYGYPGADGLDSAGHVVAHATRALTGYIGGSYTVKNVSLKPGQVASTILEGDIGSGAGCSAGVSLVVTAPNLFHSTPLTGAPYVCGFTIHPVVAGSTGR